MAEGGVERPAVFRAEPLLGGGLGGVGECPATFGADVAEHAGERVQVDAMTPGDGQQAHRSTEAHQAPAPVTTAVRIKPFPRFRRPTLAAASGAAKTLWRQRSVYFMETA